jgi:hypothetical protein
MVHLVMVRLFIDISVSGTTITDDPARGFRDSG